MAGGAIALALAFGTAAANEPIVAVDSQRHGDVIDIRATALLAANTDTSWRVLTDYDRYPEFIPDLRATHVVARHGSAVTVQQSGDIAVGPFRIPTVVTFEILETRPGRLESRAVAGSLRGLTSVYQLTSEGAGSRLDYTGHVDARLPLLGGMEQRAVEKSAARHFRALVEEIERQAPAVPSHSTDAGRRE